MIRTLWPHRLFIVALTILGVNAASASEKAQIAATPAQIQSANCALRAPPSTREIWDWLEEMSRNSSWIESADVHGISLVQQRKRLVEALRALLEPRDEFYSPLPKLQKRYPSLDCSDVRCAVEALFGAEPGARILYILVRYGLNPSPIAFPGSARWKVDELDDVILGLSDFPEHLLVSLERQPLILSREDSGDAIANRKIVLFPAWRRESREIRRYAIFHENAHRLGQIGGYDSSEEWQGLSGGWSEPYTKFTTIASFKGTPKAPRLISSLYGETNPIEDFAEAMAQYRYAPEILDRDNPAKFAALRSRFFDGMDYREPGPEGDCGSTNRPSETATQDFLNEWKRERLVSDDNSRIILQSCPALLQEVFSKPGRIQRSLNISKDAFECAQSAIFERKFERFIHARLESLGIQDRATTLPTLVRQRLTLHAPREKLLPAQEIALLLERTPLHLRLIVLEAMLSQIQEMNALGKLYSPITRNVQEIDCKTFSTMALSLRIKASAEFQRIYPTPEKSSIATLQLLPLLQPIFRATCERLPASSPNETLLSRLASALSIEKLLKTEINPPLPGIKELDAALQQD